MLFFATTIDHTPSFEVKNEGCGQFWGQAYNAVRFLSLLAAGFLQL